MQRVRRSFFFVSIEENFLHAKSVEAVLFVNIGDNALHAKSAQGASFCEPHQKNILNLMRSSEYT